MVATLLLTCDQVSFFFVAGRNLPTAKKRGRLIAGYAVVRQRNRRIHFQSGFIAQNQTNTYMPCLSNSQILFSKRARKVGANPIKTYLKRLWLVAIATILSKTLTIRFLFMSVIAHN